MDITPPNYTGLYFSSPSSEERTPSPKRHSPSWSSPNVKYKSPESTDMIDLEKITPDDWVFFNKMILDDIDHIKHTHYQLKKNNRTRFPQPRDPRLPFCKRRLIFHSPTPSTPPPSPKHDSPPIHRRKLNYVDEIEKREKKRMRLL